jgi:hypothetical protein
MNRRWTKRLGLLAVLGLLAGGWWAYRAMPWAGVPSDTIPVDRVAAISPDYVDCVIPPNIAPLNFQVREPGSQYRVHVHAPEGGNFLVASRRPAIAIPRGKWQRLLAANQGGEIWFDVYVRGSDGQWQQFQRITNHVAAEPADPYLVYRIIGPLHNYWKETGIFQRHVASFDEEPVLRSSRVSEEDPCLNCHSFVQGDPTRLSLHVRSTDGPLMLVAQDDSVTAVDTRAEFNPAPAAYISWHPSGLLAAFSTNKLSLQHSASGDSREVFDAHSDLGVFVVASNTVVSSPALADPDYLETFPAWSPDGHYLYFSRTRRTWPADIEPHEVPAHFQTIRYDLMRISYDIDTGLWGVLETVLAAAELNRTLLEPRVSPDGRFLLFTTADYGNFPVWYDSSDLYMMDLNTREYWPLVANSDHADTWHSWSSNGRWIVFASKRRDGVMFARLYLSYIDRNGRSHKPVLLPQRDPTFYDSFPRTYNAPEFTTGPIPFGEKQLAEAVRSLERGEVINAVTGASTQSHEPPPAAP